MVNILVVDDERALRKNLAFYLRSQGYETATAESSQEALNKVKSEYFDIIIADYKLPDMPGNQLMKEVKSIHPSSEFIMITGYGSIPLAVEAIREGASEFLTKPIEYSAILDKIEKILKNRQYRIAPDGEKYSKIIARSQKMKDVMDLAAVAAKSDVSILIEGETGTGKELFGRSVHRQSKRATGNFVTVECSVSSESELCKEIFGDALHGGENSALSRADNGTLFLRDVDKLGLNLQVRILRFMEEGCFSPVDSTAVNKADVRIMASTTKSLRRLVAAGSFREDLYYRLSVMLVYIPPLRVRPADIFPLVEHFLAKYKAKHNKKIVAVAPEALRWMQTYRWPGNVQELENIMARACALAKNEILDESLIFTLPQDRPESEEAPAFLNMTLKDNQKTLILRALKQNRGNYSRTAAQLGISRTTLWRRMKKFKIEGLPVGDVNKP